jgi:histidinol dehydrogenase
VVRANIADVVARGDAALDRVHPRFDAWRSRRDAAGRDAEIDAALAACDPEAWRPALRPRRIEAYTRAEAGWLAGPTLGVTGLALDGARIRRLYVPGGTASYPSSASS